MVGTKALGFIAAAVGVVTLVGWSLEDLRAKIYTVVPQEFAATYLLVGGLILVVVGILLISNNKKGTKKVKEVPIFQGEHIIGYRRH